MNAPVAHTPGPWEAQNSEVYSGDRCISDSWQCSDLPAEECHANARLIAAAPDMLEALESLPLNEFGEDMENCDAADFVDNSRELFDAMIKARAVIRKIRGAA